MSNVVSHRLEDLVAVAWPHLLIVILIHDVLAVVYYALHSVLLLLLGIGHVGELRLDHLVLVPLIKLRIVLFLLLLFPFAHLA